MTIEQSILRLIFPEKVFEWFEAVDGTKDGKEVRIVFEGKNIGHGREHGGGSESLLPLRQDRDRYVLFKPSSQWNEPQKE